MEYKLLKTLLDYDPVVVSTICVGLDTPASDVDIICCVPDISLFVARLRSKFETMQKFTLEHGDERVVCRFCLNPFQIEIFAQNIPVEQQAAYRHLKVMLRLVKLGGEGFVEQIRELKLSGLKTEPAIAHALSLEGDPFKQVLGLEQRGDAELLDLIEVAGMA